MKLFLIGLGCLAAATHGTLLSAVAYEDLGKGYDSPSGRYTDYYGQDNTQYTLDRGSSGSLNTLTGSDGSYRQCYRSIGGTYMECY